MKLKNDWWGYSSYFGWAVIVEILESRDGGDALFYGFKDHRTFNLPFKNLEDHGITFSLRYFENLSDEARKAARAEFETYWASWPVIQAKRLGEQQQKLKDERERAETALRLADEHRNAANLEEIACHERQMQEYQEAQARRLTRASQDRAAIVDQLKQRMLAKQRSECGQIEAFIEVHEIRHLVHFTRIENLTSIMEHGIVSRAELPPGFVSNDSSRFDEFLEASCLTVGYPNWSMFYKYRCQYADSNWAVLTVSPDALTTLPCLFHASNAASGQFRDKSAHALETRMGLCGLQAMFYDEPPGIRNGRSLDSCWTTDPQAEILIFETIPVDSITSVTLLRPDDDAVAKVAELDPAMPCSIGGWLFKPRRDYQFWQSRR